MTMDFLIDHIVLNVTDVEKEVEFYSVILGHKRDASGPNLHR